jgi:hypothetical protein
MDRNHSAASNLPHPAALNIVQTFAFVGPFDLMLRLEQKLT